MDAPLGSDELAASVELQRLRRRAYGPDADIMGDGEAQARLSELEAAQRLKGTPVVNAAPQVTGPVQERTRVPDAVEGLTNGRDHLTARDGVGGQPPTDGAQTDGQARGSATNASPPAALETTPRSPHSGRIPRILPWVIAAVAVLVATITTGVIVVNEANAPKPVMQLTPQADPVQGAIPIDEEIARDWGVRDDADFVWYGSYGAAEIWSTTTAGPKRCLAVVVLGGTWRFTCTAPTIDTIADIDIDPDMVPPAPSGEPASNIRFVLHDRVVDVYLVPHPEGGFYS